MPRLVLGEVVKILQRRYRRVLRCRIYQYAAVQIQKIFRGMIGRNLMLQYRYERNVKCANLIKREYFIYAERKRLRLLKYREHMAAYKIQVTHTHTYTCTQTNTQTNLSTHIANQSDSISFCLFFNFSLHFSQHIIKLSSRLNSFDIGYLNFSHITFMFLSQH